MQVTEVRHGRNFIRHNDVVRVLPSKPGKHDGFKALFRYADEDKGGQYYCLLRIESVQKKPVACGFRFIPPARVKRKATTRDPRR